MKMPPSIFNEVIGPIMRGPSSSHTAAAARIGELVRQSVGEPARVVAEFDVNGSLAATHEGQGSDMGFTCGLLGIPLTEQGVDKYAALARRAGLEVEFPILDYGAEHPNNYRITATSRSGAVRHWEAVSIGGGMIEMRSFEGFPLLICGDFYEALFIFECEGGAGRAADAAGRLTITPDYSEVIKEGGRELLSLKYSAKPDEAALRRAADEAGAADAVFLSPILPTLSRKDCEVPFLNAAALLAADECERLPMWRHAARYEALRGGGTEESVVSQMEEIIEIMERAVDGGLAGTSYEDRILGPQAHLIAHAAGRGALLPCGLLNDVIEAVTAVMETKSSMGVIVAAPTAGSCGCLPGSLIGAARAMGKGRREIAQAMLSAGLVGVFIAEAATFAAEVGGCQVECGAGSGMAAAGLADLMGGTTKQCVAAASMALQSVTGLACDTVADRVEVPCLGKNVMAASNAVASANMALAGFDPVLPLDETIDALYDVGKSLPSELRCTFGGLGKCPTARRIFEGLKARKELN